MTEPSGFTVQNANEIDRGILLAWYFSLFTVEVTDQHTQSCSLRSGFPGAKSASHEHLVAHVKTELNERPPSTNTRYFFLKDVPKRTQDPDILYRDSKAAFIAYSVRSSFSKARAGKGSIIISLFTNFHSSLSAFPLPFNDAPLSDEETDGF